MTDTATHQTVTIEAAAVTIRVVHVADKPMTIAVYEQLPQRDDFAADDVPIGWVNRCPKTCGYGGLDHHHVLAARHGEPVLVWCRRPTAWGRVSRMHDGDIDAVQRKLAEAKDQLAQAKRQQAKQQQQQAKQQPTHADKWYDERNAGWVKTCTEKVTAASHELDMARESATDWAAWVQRWGPAVRDLPQLYIAR